MLKNSPMFKKIKNQTKAAKQANIAKGTIRGMQLESAEWASAPVKYAEWHVMGLNIEQNAPRQLCVNKELYKNE